MLKPCLEAVIQQSGVDPKKIEEVIIGNVLAPGAAVAHTRLAMFLAGIPETTACQSINRLCSSGLQSVASIANAIKAGDIEIGIGGGFESMSNYDMKTGMYSDFVSKKIWTNEGAKACRL